MAKLYLVSTPIGNMKDITLRAIEVLWSVDFVICEDTRQAVKLFNEYRKEGRKYPELVSYNDHNRDHKTLLLLQRLVGGQSAAFISDRGTPLISDPGYKLVQKVMEINESGHSVDIETLPGPTALIPALQLSGFPPDKFYFVGYLPRKRGDKKKLLENAPQTTIIGYESPHRLVKCLKELLEIIGDKDVCVCFEITKLNERSVRGKISEVISKLGDKKVKGEIVVVMDMRR